MTSMAPRCNGCECEMSVDEEPWTAVVGVRIRLATDYRTDMHSPIVVFYCPDCEWAAGTFAENMNGEVVPLEDNTPGTVLGLLAPR